MRFTSESALALAMASGLASALYVDEIAHNVDGNAYLNVDGNTHLNVDGNAHINVDGNAHVNVDELAHNVDGNAYLNVDGNANVNVDGNAHLNVDGNAHLSANELAHLAVDLSSLSNLATTVHADISLDKDLNGHVLAAGTLVAGGSVGGSVVSGGAAASADVEVSVICDKCYTRGNIEASVSLDNKVPALELTITDIEAKLDLDIKASAAANIAVNLLTAAAVDLPFLGLDLAATVFLDLVLGVSTEIDLSAGLEIELIDKATLSTNILTGDILAAAFTGIEVTVLPIQVRIGCTEVHATLRLRVELDADVKTKSAAVMPLLNIVPEIGAGLELAVYVNLIEYIGLFCPTESCPLAIDTYNLNVGAVAELDVAVEDVAHVHLAPTVSLALLAAPTATHCAHDIIDRLPLGGHVTASVPGTVTATSTGTASASASATGSGSASITGTATSPSDSTETGTENGSGSMTGTENGSGSITGTATSPSDSTETGTENGSGSMTGSVTDSASITGTATSPSDSTETGTENGSGSSTDNTGSGSMTSEPSTSETMTVPPGYVVSTVTQTATYTLTTCAVNVPNCPGGFQGETTLVHTTVYTTVCPATASITEMYPKPTTTAAEESMTTAAITHPAAVPCSSVNTFVAPTNVAYPSSAFSASMPATTAHSASSIAYSTTEVKPTDSAMESYPAGSPAKYSAAETYPVEYPAAQTYPAEYPVTETHPIEQPTKSAYPTAPYYPSLPVPPVHSNGTTAATTAAHVPSTMATYPVGPTGGAPTKTGTYPVASHPVESHIPTAGASKQVASGIVLAVAGIVAALF